MRSNGPKTVALCAASLAVALAGCDARPRAPREDPVGTSPRTATAPVERIETTGSAVLSAVLPPAPPEEPFVMLDVKDHPTAVVSMGRGGGAKPLVVATHGNFDRPEWQCEVFRSIVADTAFVLCPRGNARSDSPSLSDTRYTYASNTKLEAEIEAGRDALAKRFGDRIAPTPAIYAGFSLGAIMGVPILGRTAKGKYDRAVLIEGGYDRIDAKSARALADAGLVKVLIACGQAGCFHVAKGKSAILEKAGIATRTVGSKTAGHTYDGEVADAVRDAWSWLTAQP